MIQLFIENRIYKRIEECETYEGVQQAVLKGLQPFRNQLTRDITMDDVEMLLSLQIKRISKFDLKKNEEDKLKINLELKEVERHLKTLTNYAIDYLQRLIDKYSKQYKRKTQLTTAEEIDVRELTANELAIAYDQERGFLGHQVKAEPAFRCSPLDRLLLVWDYRALSDDPSSRQSCLSTRISSISGSSIAKKYLPLSTAPRKRLSLSGSPLAERS